MTVSHCWPDEMPQAPAYAFAHLRRNGTEKVRYKTEKDALAQANRWGFTGHNAYRCRECGGWHVGRVNAP